MNHQELFHLLALKHTEGIGNVLVKHLISYSGSAEKVFTKRKKELLKIPGIGLKVAANIINRSGYKSAEKEINFIKKNDIAIHCYYSEAFPERLKHHTHLPYMFFSKGKPNLNIQKTLGIVGTRRCTDYGKQVTRNLIRELSTVEGLSIISGLAFGIDKIAHQTALEYNIPTIGILGHGLQTIYPEKNKGLGKKMLDNEGSGLVSQFCSFEKFVPANFPRRNELIAGFSDAILIIESAEKGGAKITAELAFDMNKDVFAVPGNIYSEYSKGCNLLIKQHKAMLVNEANDIIKIMNWDNQNNNTKTQKKLFIELTDFEDQLVNLLKNKNKTHIDELVNTINSTQSKLSTTLLSLEMKGIVTSLPGKLYKLSE